MTEREAFLKAIQDDPEDVVVRKVFADYLDDHDEPELADFYRSWTLEKYQEGKKYLESLAEYIQQDGRDAGYGVDDDWVFSYDNLLSGLIEAVNTNVDTIFFTFDTPDRLTETDTKKKMWEAFQWVTCIRVQEEYDSVSPFRCGC